ncbi:MAG: ABC transporter ATP-binding protein [Gammaproteobacteria bacterium]|nr:MAG: ABC transporter ATP-binding protein [Gammaproteobacteria bacterium]
MTVTIETQNLTRIFGDFVAVDKLNLSINSGEIFGLLGPNAAGKSTTIRLLAGILRPNSGEASILGFNLFTQTELIKQRIGYVAQQFSLYPDLTVFENIMFYAGLYGVDNQNRLHELLDLYDLIQFKNKNAGLLSGGYKRRLAIACATTHDPELLFLDEPTAGIDPVTRKELWDLFYSLSTNGKTLFVTTHYMEEAERCNRLAFLSHGKLVAQGTPIEIRGSLKDRRIYSSDIPHDPVLTTALMKSPGIQLVNQFGSELRIITDTSVSPEQLQYLIAENYKIPFKLQAVTPSIEDAFILLTSNGEKQ